MLYVSNKLMPSTKLIHKICYTGQNEYVLKEKGNNIFFCIWQDLRRPTYEDLTADVDQSLTCPVCLEMFYLPCLCQPCGHIFCDPCLRRLTGHGSEGVLCPLCRRVIQCCVLDKGKYL